MVHTHPQHPPPPPFEMELLYFLIFQEMKTPKKAHCVSGNRNPKKASYISGNILRSQKTLLYFLERKLFLYFGKRKPWNKIIFQIMRLSYISENSLPSSKNKKTLLTLADPVGGPTGLVFPTPTPIKFHF